MSCLLGKENQVSAGVHVGDSLCRTEALNCEHLGQELSFYVALCSTRGHGDTDLVEPSTY